MSIIQEVKGKIKRIGKWVGEPDVFTALVVILVAFLAFGLGRLSVLESKKPSVELQTIPAGSAGAAAVLSSSSGGSESGVPAPDSKVQYVASRNGTKYYFPWCSGVDRIKEENKVWFETKENAQKAGYTPSSTCKGL